METLRKQFDIPVKYEYDVAVIGGGPAGFASAVAAARNGARTILVEQNGSCGGMATAGLVAPFMTSYNKSGDKMIIRGLFEELVDRLLKEDGAIHPDDCRSGDQITGYHFRGHDHCTAFDAEVLKRVIDDMLTEANVKILYHTTFVEPLTDENTVNGVIIHSKDGLSAIKADVVIDASGDADVAYRAGVKCEKGDIARGSAMQPATMFFRIGNVDWEKVDEVYKSTIDEKGWNPDGTRKGLFTWLIDEAREKGEFNVERKVVGIYRGVQKDEWSVNISRINGIDGTSAEDLSKAEIIGRKQVVEIFNFLKNYVPGCENIRLLSTAATIGIRETRHIKGVKTLTADDVLNGYIPEDTIFLASNSIDVHAGAGANGTKYITVQNGEWYGVSYGCLVPEKVEGLLVAGRTLSASSEGAGAVRVMPPCIAMGHAAGIAAAMAVKNNLRLRDVDINALQAQLLKEGAFLG